MNSGVKIVKRRKDEPAQILQLSAEGGGAKPREREIAKTVRNWIAEREERRRASERKHWEILAALANGTAQ